MAKIKKRNLDSLKASPVRKSSYQAPSVRRSQKHIPPEYRTLQKAKTKHGGFLFFLFVLFLAAAGGFYYWNNKDINPFDRSMTFKVEGPEEIVSGDQVTYKVEYKNVDQVPLQQMELDVRWPAGFYFDEASIEPSDENATTWFLPDIAPGETKSIEIKGQLVGNKEEKVTAAFNLQYVPENFNSDFKEKENIDTTIIDSKVELVIQAQEKSLVATEEQFKIIVKNTSDEKLEKIYLDLLLPDDFVVSGFGEKAAVVEETDEEADTEEVVDTSTLPGRLVKAGDYWVLDLEPNTEDDLVVRGSFTADSKSEQLLVAEVGNLVDEKFRRLSRVEQNLTVVNPQFDVKLQINGKTESQTVDWGEDLRYQLEITNNSGTDIKDVMITALIDGEVLDWEKLETVGKYEESKIVWTSAEDEFLANWPADESKIFTWQVEVVGEPVVERNIENIIKLNIQDLDTWEQISKPLLLSVGESLTFNNGIYWDLGGRRVGSGVMPPQVGATTDYLVVWSITEATGDFSSVTVETVLPPDVTFVTEADIPEGEFYFDEETRSVIWTMSEFGDVLLPTAASFMIQIEPGLQHKGEAMTLLNSTTLTGSGQEEIVVKSKLLKTSDAIVNSDEPVGIVQ